MSQRRPKDRSHWGDAAFKAMHDKPEAKELAEAARKEGWHPPDCEAVAWKEVARLREALLSIAANTCCDRCQEAARVAHAAYVSSSYRVYIMRGE